MDEAREKELREKAQEAIERWNSFMTTEEVIEKMIELLDEAKKRNQEEEMLGFRFIWENETSKWAVFPVWASKKECEELFLVTIGRCRSRSYFRAREFWKDIKKLQSCDSGTAKILMTEFTFE